VNLYLCKSCTHGGQEICCSWISAASLFIPALSAVMILQIIYESAEASIGALADNPFTTI